MTSIILFLSLAISLVTDIKNRKILNVVTFPTMALGVMIHSFESGWSGLLFSLVGLTTGFGLLFIPYVLGGIAAGDVKLLMAIGALKGAAFVFGSFLYTALTGGIIASIILIKQRKLIASLHRIFILFQLRSLKDLNKDELHDAFPYGVAICLGTLTYYGVTIL